MEREAPSWAPGDHPHTTRRGRTLRSSPHHQPGGRWLESLAMLADPRSCRVPGLGGSAPFARPHPWLLRCIAQGGWASPPTPAQNGCLAHARLGPLSTSPLRTPRGRPCGTVDPTTRGVRGVPPRPRVHLGYAPSGHTDPPPGPPGPPHVVRSTPSTHMGGPGGAPPAEGGVWATPRRTSPAGV